MVLIFRIICRRVEHWMKNKWLQFKENPKIVPENAITLEDLPKA